MARVLLHTCCGPCATYTVKQLRQQDWEVVSFWYNPNIHPYREHQRRLEALQSFASVAALPLIIPEGYEMVRYLRTVVGHEGERCPDCYRLRLGRTARAAAEGGYDAFSTTLLISPYQKHELLREVGEEMVKEYGVPFYYEDLRPGFRESRNMARELGLYLQGYCGCIYSEWERYGKVDVGAVLSLSKDGFEG